MGLWQWQRPRRYIPFSSTYFPRWRRLRRRKFSLPRAGPGGHTRTNSRPGLVSKVGGGGCLSAHGARALVGVPFPVQTVVTTPHMCGVSVYETAPRALPRTCAWAASALLSSLRSPSATGAYRPPPPGGALGWSTIPRTSLSTVIANGLARALRECWVTPEGPPCDPRPVPIPAGQPRPLNRLRFQYGAHPHWRSR
eukprot:gene4356-biopygen5416